MENMHGSLAGEGSADPILLVYSTFERSSETPAKVAFCRSLREAEVASVLSGMVTAHLEWSICFCNPTCSAAQIRQQDPSLTD